MVPKVVTDTGYTVVGLGVLAVQQVQSRRRATRARLQEQVQATRQGLESAVGQAQERIAPFAARVEPLKTRVEVPLAAALDRVPRIPGPIGTLVTSGTERLQSALATEAEQEPVPSRPATRAARSGGSGKAAKRPQKPASGRRSQPAS